MAFVNSNVASISRNPVAGPWERQRASAAGVPVFMPLPGMPTALKPHMQFVRGGLPFTAASMPVATGRTRSGRAVARPLSLSPFGPTGLGGVDGVFDFVKDLVPSNTVVGKALRGDYSGAAQGAVKEASKYVAAARGSGSAPAAPDNSAPVYYDTAAPAPQGSGLLINKPLLFASLGLGALGVFLLVRSRR